MVELVPQASAYVGSVKQRFDGWQGKSRKLLSRLANAFLCGGVSSAPQLCERQE
jgi:hypothetical protein